MAPCEFSSGEGIIGLLDLPDTIVNPGGMRADLIWNVIDYVDYNFSNNIIVMKGEASAPKFSMERSCEVPGTVADWPSGIKFSVDWVEAGTRTSPGDYLDKRHDYQPEFWKLNDSLYGKPRQCG